MTAPRYRAWRFVHPSFDGAKGMAAGLAVARNGAIDMVDDAASVRQAILLLLSTRRGERVMRPDYGCDLHRLVFSPNDATTAGLAIHYVRQAIEQWEPRVRITRVDANPSGTDLEQLDIVLEYRVRGSEQSQDLRFSIALDDGAL